jgi:imidazole glycerol-phosphate synthase subunit HisH
MNVVGIVDYGMCNLDSVARAVEECGGSALVTDQPGELKKANRIILPGVGSFSEAMNRLRARSLDTVLSEVVLEKQIPFLGICLGMHMLATDGTEGGHTQGLGWIEGEVRRLEPNGEDTRIPHIGWNELSMMRPSSLFDGIPANRDFYFVHSYHLAPSDDSVIVARTAYGKGFVSALQKGWIFAVQFHPEKSQRAGLSVLRNFLAV